MFLTYQIVLTFGLIISPVIIFLRILKNKEDKKRFIEKFSFSSKRRRNGKLIWFHGASIGEILSVIPLIKNYEKNRLIDQILITSSTLSSAKVLDKYNLKKTIHQFYPIDHIFFTNKFLKYWKPDMAIFIESEIWPCMFQNLNSKKIPLILLNARFTKNTFYRWMKIKRFFKLVLNNIKIVYPQNLETKKFLNKIKFNRAKFIGNIKFVENNEKVKEKINTQLNSELKKKKIWVASSTHENEEIFCAKTHIKLKKRIKNLITIIIPRHVHRCVKIKKSIENLGLKVKIHSSNKKDLKNTDIYLVDTFGETKKFHKISSTVFLGGSIINRGGQNPLEAARYGAKILHGSNTDNFKDVYKLLKTMNISKLINTPDQLASSIIFTKKKKIGLKVKKIGDKILKKTIKELDNLIINEFKKT
ncbi:3-deoxy-D-manno-octulosonic acid transferase [Candidatus Pelagibacter sp. HIMB1509]|uniref:3-deoxy-D-manno-octulosonic acid transferase n=1 Tax=Candidatus Pelagibacter sp. HIMB1509 TaxID=3413339 RepID=UPI003F86388B